MKLANNILEKLIERISNEPDVDNFVLWKAGTLEYWIHILFNIVGSKYGWASRTEVPYKIKNDENRIKWADGAICTKEGQGVLVEVKNIALGVDNIKNIKYKNIINDLAALLAIDWAATKIYERGTYTDVDWWHRRNEIKNLIILQIVIVHGGIQETINGEGFKDQLQRTLAGLPMDANNKDLIKVIYPNPIMEKVMSFQRSKMILLAWAREVDIN